jgi:Major Facilitator Superfamily
VFYLLASMAIASSLSLLAIPKQSIDHDLARGLHDAKSRDDKTTGDDHPSGFTVLLTCRPLLIFAGCAIMFHFANAAMLPLVGQKLALQDKNLGTSLMSACIVAAQIVMVPMAMLVGAKADAWGRKPLFLIALSVLTIRGCLYPLSDNPYWLVGVQLLDGVGAGIYGAVFPVIVADLMRGTGRFNVAQGAIITAQDRCGAVHHARWNRGCPGRVQRGLPYACRCRHHWACALFLCDARNTAPRAGQSRTDPKQSGARCRVAHKMRSGGSDPDPAWGS